jgi:hypothetical protein
MKNVVKCAALGLSVIIGTFAVAAPARADYLVNISGEENNNQQFCMGVSAGNMTPGTPIILWQCLAGHPDQNWNLNYLPTRGWDQVVDSALSDRCLEAKDGDTANGTQLVIADCTTTSDEGFVFEYAGSDQNGDNCYKLLNEDSQTVVGVSGGTIKNGQPIILWTDLGHSDQIWCLRGEP